MSQHFEERLRDSANGDAPKTAQILPFERPPSELQRAVRERAQQTLDRERDRDAHKGSRAPVWIVGVVLAAIPVLLLYGAVDGFLRALHQYMTLFSEDTPAETTTAPDVTTAPSVDSSTPGVVILQPLNEPVQPVTQPPASPPQTP